MKRIPIQFMVEPGALPTAEACKFLGGISRTQLWRLKNKPKSDPRRIAVTSYGTFPVEGLRQHLKAETAKA